MSQLVRAASLSNYALIARQFGLDPAGMLRRHGLDPLCLHNPDLRIPATAVAELLEASATSASCPTFGLRMAESRQLSEFGAVSLLLRHQTTLRSVLDVVTRYRHQLNDALSLHLEQEAGDAILRETMRTLGNMPARQSIELAIGVMFRLLRALLGAQWTCNSVTFEHAAPDNGDVHRRVFGIEVAFNSRCNSIVFPASDLDRPNPRADAVMVRYAQRMLESTPVEETGSVVADVRNTLQQLLPLGHNSIEQVAQNLGINVRTLQRRLEDAGATFSTLQTSIRRDLALRYLEDRRYAVQQIGPMLGFAAPSVFSRWFYGQFGVAPRAWRKNLLQHSDLPKPTTDSN